MNPNNKIDELFTAVDDFAEIIFKYFIIGQFDSWGKCYDFFNQHFHLNHYPLKEKNNLDKLQHFCWIFKNGHIYETPADYPVIIFLLFITDKKSGLCEMPTHWVDVQNIENEKPCFDIVRKVNIDKYEGYIFELLKRGIYDEVLYLIRKCAIDNL